MSDKRPCSQDNVRVVEFYAGIGGLHLALTRSCVPAVVVRAFDWDQAACQVYEVNHGPNIVQKVDISKLSTEDLCALQADLWLLSPSCQPYTVLNPLAKGSEDPRAKSFIHLIEDVLPDLVSRQRHPKHLLVENVAGFETSSTRLRLLQTLHTHGYTTLELLLTPLQFGIPNSRLRYYLLAKIEPLHFPCVEASNSDTVWRHIPGDGADWKDPRDLKADVNLDIYRAATIREYLDDEDVPGNDSVIPDRVLEKWGRLFDIVTPESKRTCCFTRGYTKMAERSGSVLQMNEELDTTTVFDQFLAEHKAGHLNAVHILHSLRLRYFSPSELLRLFCFIPCSSSSQSDSGLNNEFRWPQGISTKTKYKLIGNSVNVAVVSRLIEYLFK